MAERQPAIPLESADDDARCDANAVGEPPDCSLTEADAMDELSVLQLRDQGARGKPVGLPFLWIFAAGAKVQEDLLLAVPKDVASFVEEGKPELVVRFVAQA